MNSDLEKIRAVADYQLGSGAGAALFSGDVQIEYSKNTGRIRHIYADEQMVANYRPNDGLFTLTIEGARRLVRGVPGFRYAVEAQEDVMEFIEKGENLFAKHVVDACPSIRPGDEVVVLDHEGEVAAVGKAVLNRGEMLLFKKGVAVKVRRGRSRHR